MHLQAKLETSKTICGRTDPEIDEFGIVALWNYGIMELWNCMEMRTDNLQIELRPDYETKLM